MATLIYSIGTSQFREIISRVPTLLDLQFSSSSLYQFGAGNYSEYFIGTGLARSSGSTILGTQASWTGGTLTSFESRNGSTLIAKYSDLALPAIELNRLDTDGITLSELLLRGDDFVTGSPFSDNLTSYGGNDRIDGGAGNDLIYDDGGSDIYDGGTGVDTLDATDLTRSQITLNRSSPNTWTLAVPAYSETNTLSNIEYLKLSDTTISLLDLALGTPTPPDLKGTQVFRFAKLDSGQYFYTGSIGERDLIVATMSNFRYEGPVFFAQDNWVTNFNPVYRFANLVNGGYFYTASPAERDSVISDYPSYRYEGASFFVPASAGADTVPVFRLANTRTGGYLFTTNPAERQYAQSLGFFRDEGIAFNAPRTISLSDAAPDRLALDGDESLALVAIDPASALAQGWLI